MGEEYGHNFPQLDKIPEVLGGCTFYNGHCVDFYFTDMEGLIDQDSFFSKCHHIVLDYRATGRHIPYYLFNYEFGTILIVSHYETMVVLLLQKSTEIDYIISYILDTLKANDELSSEL